jgi:pSer/pThr/pTyr-binding forkhead associated (FHA) protein
MALALYGFLGWALYLLWREVQKQGQSLANRRVPGISLMIRHEQDTPILKHFFQSEIILGRDPGCDIPLSDDTVSTRHAHLMYHHSQWWLEDLASTNGTILNEAAVDMPTVITSGDEIMCGGTHITVSLSENVVIEPTLPLERKK